MGESFNQAESFIGEITQLNVWDHILEDEDIVELYLTCNNVRGNTLTWSQFQQYQKGKTERLSSEFCQG